MTDGYPAISTGGANWNDEGAAAARGVAKWLCLAATPTFAIMALLTRVLGGGTPDLFCSAATNASPLSGMVLMYLLMSAFHSPAWLKLISSRRSRARFAGWMTPYGIFWRERFENLRKLLKEIDP